MTATKRSEKLQDIPLSVAVVTGKDLERGGINSVDDALRGLAGINSFSGGNTLAKNIIVRGVSDGPFGGLSQSTVSLYVDDIPITVAQVSGNVGLALYDIDQVSVIRGPRSTLYGSASLGGTVKIETKTPSLSRASYGGSVDISNTRFSGGASVDGYVRGSTPVIKDRLSLGLVAYRNTQNGFIDNAVLGRDIDDVQTQGFRASLFAAPTKNYTLSLKYSFQNIDGNSASQFSPTLGGDLIDTAILAETPYADRFRAIALVQKYHAPWFDVVSATSHFTKKAPYSSDLSLFFVPILGLPSGTTLQTRGSFNSNVTSQEIRLTSVEQKRGLVWSAGGFYSTETTDNNANTPSPIGELNGSLTRFAFEQAAVFGELGLKFGNGLELNGGLRYTRYNSQAAINFLGLFAIPGQVDVNFREDPLTPHASISYHLGSQLIYFQYSRGFRLGKGNFPVLPAPGFDVPAFSTSDSLNTYEVGAKTSWLNQRLIANLSAYRTDWNNPQLTLALPNGFTFINSLGALSPGAGIRIYGGEVELVATLIRNLFLTTSGGVSSSTITQDARGLDPTGAITPAGTRTAGVPLFTGNGSVHYDFRLLGRAANVDVAARYVGGYASAYGVTAFPLADYVTLNVRYGMRFGPVNATVYASNVTDARPLLSNFLLSGIFEGATTIRPRSIGIKIGVEH